MTPEAALAALKAAAEPGRAAQVAAYMKVERAYLGVPMPAVNELTKGWRRTLTLEERVALADALWATDIHEARVAAAKLLTQARIKGDDAVWRLILSWLPDFDGWAIADHVCMAGQRRVVADPSRIDQVEGWTGSHHPLDQARRPRHHPALDQAEPPQTRGTCRARPGAGLGRGLRRRPRMVHPESGGLVAARAVETRPGAGAAVSGGTWGQDESIRPQGGRQVPGIADAA